MDHKVKPTRDETRKAAEKMRMLNKLFSEMLNRTHEVKKDDSDQKIRE